MIKKDIYSLSSYDYNLPKSLIAQTPIEPRDHCRLLVLKEKNAEHKYFYNLLDYLKSGDVLVLNQTKVFPARLIGKKTTGGKVEIFLLKQLKGKEWEVLAGGKKQLDQTINFGTTLSGQLKEKISEKTWRFVFDQPAEKIMSLVSKVGLTPIPPYIKTNYQSPITNHQLAQEYQTVFAKELGSVAAPTAGLHFTKKLLTELKKKGVQIEYVTLHVGLGTFAEVTAQDIRQHKLHSEWVEVDQKTAKALNKAKKEGRRVIAVGTTSLRLLEAMSDARGLKAGQQWVNIFIYPGYKFKIVDDLITNFHLPKSSLLMLVSALVGLPTIKKVYQTAIKKKYRFYSFGDAMLIIK